MKWVTRERVHLDRVATPWLITRFVDPDAEFAFVPAGTTQLPADATPFSLPGAALSPQDSEGSTFRKVLVKHGIADDALAHMAGIVESGIASALGPGKTAFSEDQHREGAGINAYSEGMLLSGKSDHEILEASFPVYDTLYRYCRAKQIVAADEKIANLPLNERYSALSKLLA